MTDMTEYMESGRIRTLMNLGLQAGSFIKKDFTIALSYKLQFTFQFVQIFFSIALIYFIGKMLHTSGSSPLLKQYGADYFSFALVGLAVTSYLKAGLVTITNDIRQVMNQGTFEAMCAAPIGYNRLLLCGAMWPFVFETIRVIFHFLVAMTFFGMKLNCADWSAAVVGMLLTIPVFLMLGVISSSILVVVKKGDPINWIFSGAASLLAGTMFPIALLPGWLKFIAYCLPLTHSLEAMRKSLLAGASLFQVAPHLLALLVFTAILLPLTMAVTSICMKKAKSCGAFTTH